MNKPQHCELCERCVALTFHHLIPKKMHRRTRLKKQFNREKLNQGIWICRSCHNGVHLLYDEMTLATSFNSLLALQESKKIQKHVSWVQKQKTL